jgi:hypothetical protein
MDLNNQLDDSFNEEALDLKTRAAFLEVAKWSKGLVLIMGIILGFFVVFFGVILVFSSDEFHIVFTAIPMLLCYGIPFYYLYQFTTKSKKAIESLDDVLFTSALQNLKSFFKFWGILTLVLVAYYVFSIVTIFINMNAF